MPALIVCSRVFGMTSITITQHAGGGNHKHAMYEYSEAVFKYIQG